MNTPLQAPQCSIYYPELDTNPSIIIDPKRDSIIHPEGKYRKGFTLIELSIVLVIIGLLVGGVLVGQDLIRSAGERAQITQIEKYQTAVNTFRGKYNALPGDMDATTAAQYGFAPRGQYEGEGDGNGVLEGIAADAPWGHAFAFQGGETIMVWSDLTYANGLNLNLIEGSFSSASSTVNPISTFTLSATQYNLYVPQAKIGGNNFVFTASGSSGASVMGATNSTNYFVVTPYSFSVNGIPGAGISGGLTVAQAYDIDRKMDDGFPSSGVVTAEKISGAYLCFIDSLNNCFWQLSPSQPTGEPVTLTPRTTSCFDNGGVTGNPITYSMSQNNGAGRNCGLAFKFQ